MKCNHAEKEEMTHNFDWEICWVACGVIWMSLGKAWLTLRWTVLELSEMQALFNCNV